MNKIKRAVKSPNLVTRFGASMMASIDKLMSPLVGLILIIKYDKILEID